MLKQIGQDKTIRFLIFFFVFLFIAMILLSLNGDISHNEKKRYREPRF
jgi:hypothetical protein